MSEPTLLSLLAPALTVLMAVLTRNVLLSLGLGVLAGMTVHEGFNPLAGLVSVFEKGIFAQIAKGQNAQILILICVIGGFVYQLDQSGGMRAFAERITRRVDGPVKAQLAVWFSGMAIFFTDSGNSLILGPLFRPIFDDLKLAREKLAFVIDATSSPVCVLVPFIGWGVYIMSLIDQAHLNLGMKVDALTTLLSAMPFQLYPLLALSAVPIFAFGRREMGPMKRAAERTARGEVEEQAPATELPPEEGPAVGARAVVVPLLTVFGVIAGLFTYYTVRLGTLPGAKIRTSLVLAYLTGAVVCAIILRKRIGTPFGESFQTFLRGMQRLLTIVMILLLAWSLGEVCRLLDTSGYVASLVGDSMPPALLPAVVFILGAVIALSTGSSYGTFAILMPIAIPLSYSLGTPVAVTIAAVLSGGVLGDHASPISDTTVLSSMATGCKHADHVNTQLPYALLIGSAALLAFLVAGATGSAFSYFAGLVVLAGLVLGLPRWRDRRRKAA